MKFTIHPEHSKKRVARSGNAVRTDNLTQADVDVIENWRASHAYVLNTFQATLRRHARSSPNITVAQRLKRRSTIYDKLKREPGMSLARMHDIAGCRLIFDHLEELKEVRNKIVTARFKHERRNQENAYDYIANPKPNGYRGIHDVYKFVSFSGDAAEWDGLLFELQYRTKVQHAWSTAVEIAGSVTGNEPKFDRGNQDHIEFFRICSELLARKHENLHSCLPKLSDNELYGKFHEIEQKTGLLRLLDGLIVTREFMLDEKNLLLMFSMEDGKSQLQYKAYKRSQVALLNYFRLEEQYPDADIVLVRADSNDGIRSAFRNYFSDAREFISLIKEATEKV